MNIVLLEPFRKTGGVSVISCHEVSYLFYVPYAFLGI